MKEPAESDRTLPTDEQEPQGCLQGIPGVHRHHQEGEPHRGQVPIFDPYRLLHPVPVRHVYFASRPECSHSWRNQGRDHRCGPFGRGHGWITQDDVYASCL